MHMEVGNESHKYPVCLPCTRQVVIADVGDKDSSYQELLAVMPSSDCRYAGQCRSICCCPQDLLPAGAIDVKSPPVLY